jgi:flagellar protein FliO/FliZ
MAEGVSTFSAAMQALMGLALVVGLIVVTAYVLKRIQPGRFAASTILKPVASLSLGTRERVVVVEMGDEWLVLGVTAQNITTLHTTAKGSVATTAIPAPTFGDWLKRARVPGKSAGGSNVTSSPNA